MKFIMIKKAIVSILSPIKEIFTELAPKPIGPYSQAISVDENGLIFISGQIPIDLSTQELVSEDITIQTEQVFKNIQAVLQAAGKDFSRVVKTTVFLQDMQDFQSMNKVYSSYFKKPFPARSCIAVKTLPKNAKVEIELIVAR